MDSQVENIEKRLQRLEQLHIWGASLLAVILVGVLLVKNKNNGKS